MNKILKFLKDNLILIVPSFFVLVILVGFLIFGLTRPVSSEVILERDITFEQQQIEEEFMADYNSEIHNPSNPYIVTNPFGITPLSALFVFETVTESQYEIVVKGKEANGDLSFVTSLTTTHYIPVYGLYENYTNIVEVYEYSELGKGALVSSNTVLTDVLPDEVTRPTEVNTTYEYFGKDMMLVIPALNSYPMAIDYNGDIRFVLTKNLPFAPVFLENGHLLLGSDRLVLEPYHVTGLYEIDLLGKVYRNYKVPGGYHHDVVELPNENFLVLTNDFKGTVEDKIVEIDRVTGEVVDLINLETLLPELQGPAEMWTTYDWFHANSIDYDPISDEILLSGRHQDIVVNISRQTREINYIIGDPDNWSSNMVDAYFLTPIGEDFEWQYAQHSAMFLPNDEVVLFDNGNNKSKDSSTYVPASESYSRLVHYSIDRENMTIEQVYQFGKEIGAEFYSPYISNVDYYGEGHYMVHSGGHAKAGGEILNIPGPLYDGEETLIYKSMTYELLNGEIKYYLEISDNYYQAKRIQLYSENTSYRTGRGLVVGELAKTEAYTGIVETKFSLFDTVPELYGLSLIKEDDRLEIEGEFDADDVIYLRLLSDDEEIVYYIPTSQTDFTAMCTVTLRGDQRFVTYYINETDLQGNFQIFIVINGREYNTYQHVTFVE